MEHGSDDEMMSRSEMEALTEADGKAATGLFLTGMVQHHAGAVAMARTEVDEGTNPDATRLAESIIATQNSEITEMKKLPGG